MSNSLVSIIIPYYNKKDTINRSVDSVINQTHVNWELIIVDDNGIEPLEIDPEWENYNISYLYNEKNLGAAKTRQNGQDIAKGDYIAFLDADDWWDHKFLELCLEKLALEQACSGVYVKTLVIKEGITEIRRYNNLNLSKIRETLIQFGKPWQTGSILWRKSEVSSWGNLKTQEDSWFEISNSVKFNKLVLVEGIYYYHDEKGVNHLSHYNGISHSTLDQQELFLMIYREFWSKINLKYKIILYHRLIRGQWKIHEYCPGESKAMGNKLVSLNAFIFWIRNKPLILKLTHKVLQKSIFKINY